MSVAVPLDVIGSLPQHAIDYAAAGFEIFPVDPATKRPMAAAVPGAPSQYSATTDPDVIAEWWQRWPDALIGHRLADDTIILDIDPRHGGDTTWQALRDHYHLDSATTRIHVSGRGDGGGHLWFRRPPGRLTISQLDDWARQHGTGHAVTDRDGTPTGHWVCGLDLLHRTHRYTILPPSPHPETHKPYRWHHWADIEDAPQPIIDLLVDTRPPPLPYQPKPYQGDSIADWYSATQGLATLLHRHGWTLRRGGGDDDGSAWQHPHATSPISATVRHGCLFMYSPNSEFPVTAPGDPAGVTPFAAYAILEHGGDQAAAARAARTLKDGVKALPSKPAADADQAGGEVEEVAPAVQVYWADEVAKDPPPPIEELVTNLVSVGEVSVFGAPRAMGKTWATMQLAATLATGEGTLFGSDWFEVTRPATVAYLQGELGLSASAVRWSLSTHGRPPHVAEIFDRLRVRTTTTRVTMTVDGTTTTEEQSHALVDPRLEPLLAELDADVLIMDPWATYYGGSENSNDETEAAIDALTQMARRLGCAIWIVHHITAKATHGNLAEPEDLWRGASRLADAVATRVTMLPHYTPAKARDLGLDRFQARTFADLHVLQRNGPPVPVVHTRLEQFQWREWEPADSDGGRPPALSDRDVVDMLRGGSVTSKRRLAELLDVSRSTLDRQLDRLIQLGVVVVDEGPRRSKIYRLTDDGELP